MKKLSVFVAVAAMLVGAFGAFALAGDMKHSESMTVTGYVTDSICKADGAKAGHRDCALKCEREKGAKLGVWDATASKFYALEDQKKAEEFAGDVVTVKGTVDPATGTLKAASIMKAGGQEKKNG